VQRILLSAALLAVAAHAQDLPYKPGRSVHTIEGLKTALVVPDEISKEKPASLVVLLHGLGDSGENLIHALASWGRDGYLICAPSCTDRAWSAADVKAVLRIAQHLRKVMPIDSQRTHVLGFSNGGWNLTPLAFSNDLKPLSATYIAAGYRGGKVPKWAKKRLGVLALAGEQDANAAAAKATATQLRGKVVTAEVRLQPNLGHKWPKQHDAYLKWWVDAREGRYEAGKDMNFEWGEDLADAVAAQKQKKRGGVLVYVYGPDDLSKRLTNEVLMDPAVRFFGAQIAAVKMEFGDEAQKLGVKAAPALVVLKKDGTVKKLLAGKVKAKSLASALKSVAPNRRMPKG